MIHALPWYLVDTLHPSKVASVMASSGSWGGDYGGATARPPDPGPQVTERGQQACNGYLRRLVVNAIGVFVTHLTLNQPQGLSVDPDTGDIFFTDGPSNSIKRVSALTSAVKTAAGAPDLLPGFADGDALHGALFDAPSNVLALPGGLLLITDGGNARLRMRIDLHDGLGSAAVITLVGPGASALSVNVSETAAYIQPGLDLGPGPQVTLCRPMGLALIDDGTGGSYVARGIGIKR